MVQTYIPTSTIKDSLHALFTEFWGGYSNTMIFLQAKAASTHNRNPLLLNSPQFALGVEMMKLLMISFRSVK